MVHCQTAAYTAAAAASSWLALHTTIPPSHPLQPRGCRPPPLRFAPQHIIIIDFYNAILFYGQAIQVLEKSVSCLESVKCPEAVEHHSVGNHATVNWREHKADALSYFTRYWVFLCLQAALKTEQWKTAQPQKLAIIKKFANFTLSLWNFV